MTIFQVCDLRQQENTFRQVARQTYKKMVTVHDRAGQPFRVGTMYTQGRTVKQLTLMEHPA